jgi:peptide/nickel transport system permease protein
MKAYIFKRLLMSLSVLLTISVMTFYLLKASGDLAISLAGEGGTQEYINFLRHYYGWDKPVITQYFHWLLNIFHGDFGTSFYYGSPVTELLFERIPVTLQLGGIAITAALAIAIPLGVLAGVYRDRAIDRFAQTVALFGQATPIFWFAYLLIIVLGLKLRVLPISGSATFLHMIMPSIALAFYAMPAVIRIVRTGMIEVLEADYIRTATAKGLNPVQIIIKHALRNTLVPVVAVASVQFGFLLGGSVVVETIFALHGVGYLTWEAINQSDYPVVQAAVLTVSAFYVLLTFLSDMLNMLIDPRIRVA